MKKLVLFASVMLLGAACKADLLRSMSSYFKEPRMYRVNTNIGLEIMNKDKQPIFVVAKNGNDVSQVTEIQRKNGSTKPKVQWDIDIDKPTFVALWYTKPRDEVSFKKIEYLGIRDQPTFEPWPDKLYYFQGGNTLYLTWDGKKALRPQTGLRKGAAGVTESELVPTQ